MSPDVTSTISLGIAGSIEMLKDRFLAGHPLIESTRTAQSLAIVFATGTGADVRGGVLDALHNSQSITPFNARPGVTSDLVAAGLRRSRWVDVDVDDRAPRLRSVRLPRALVESDAVVGVADLRGAGKARPLVALGLWAPLAAPVQRIGSLITGAREGLTAEIGLAIQPAALVVVLRISAPGPLVGIVSSDPIAVELAALAIWQARLPSSIDLPGPWEDPLVQRATELGLGVSQPSELGLQMWFGDDLSADDVVASRGRLAAALSLIGVGGDG
jgi:hypothetical protein